MISARNQFQGTITEVKEGAVNAIVKLDVAEGVTISSTISMEAVKELKVMELSELVKALEEEFGVSATPVAVAGAVAGGDGAAAADAKTDFDVVLVDAGSSKIGVIKAVREITGLGLKEAKEKVDSAPQTIKEAAPEAEANEIKEKLEAAGAKVELK